MRSPGSKVGWAFVTTYLALAALFIYQAFTCVGWVCDLVEFPATVPFGLLYFSLLKLLDPIFVFGSITYSPFRNWFFIISTLIGNSIISYWLGVGLGKLLARVLRRVSA